jgi:hypothetical protein
VLQGLAVGGAAVGVPARTSPPSHMSHQGLAEQRTAQLENLIPVGLRILAKVCLEDRNIVASESFYSFVVSCSFASIFRIGTGGNRANGEEFQPLLTLFPPVRKLNPLGATGGCFV